MGGLQITLPNPETFGKRDKEIPAERINPDLYWRLDKFTEVNQ